MSKPRIMPVPLTQQAFGFVTDEEKLEMASAYDKQQERRLYVALRNTRLANITIEVLKSTVFTLKGEQHLRSLEQTDSPQIELGLTLNKEPTEADKEEDCDAFMRCLPAFLDCMLTTALQKLADVGGAEEKIDTLEWVYAGDTEFIELWIKGRRKSVQLRSIPMTFNWVCTQLGLNPDDLRQGIEAVLLESQRIANQKIGMGKLMPNKGTALGSAINFINERSTNECRTKHAPAQELPGF